MNNAPGYLCIYAGCPHVVPSPGMACAPFAAHVGAKGRKLRKSRNRPTVYAMCSCCNRLVDIGTHVQDSDECRAQRVGPRPLARMTTMPKRPKPTKPTSAAALSRARALLASAGGHARSQSLTPERRSEIARSAVAARWAKRDKGEE